MNDTLITRTSMHSVEAICQRFTAIAPKHKFGVLHIHDLKQKMESKGLAFGRECRIVEVCDPAQAHQMLTGMIAVSAALPCRVSVYVENGRTTLATIRPSALLGLFETTTEAAAIAGQVESTITQLMEEVAS